MSTMAQHMVDHPVHMEDLMNLHVDPDAAMVDPQLAFPYFGNLSGKGPHDLTVDPSIWNHSLEPFGDASPLSSCDPDQGRGDLPASPANLETVHHATTASTPPSTATQSQLSGESSRKSSNSSVPSLTSGSSSPGKRTRSKAATAKTSEAKVTRPKTRATKRKLAMVELEDDEDEGDMEDESKRNKYLERNRLAASKCRQKKKQWVGSLEAKKAELEKENNRLQNDYSALVNQVNQLKNDLMVHANCGDTNINSWIETEARRFVQRSTSRSDGSRQIPSFDYPSRRPSQSGM